MKKLWVFTNMVAVAALLSAGVAMAQPRLVPSQTGPELACSVDTSAAAQLDTVVSVPDSNGFFTIFDGKTFKGWWQNCLTTHSNGSSGIFRIDTVRQAIYSMSRSGNGGILMTKKKYAHYELVFDWWPQYGNDGGVFNRSTLTGRSNQTVLDYLSGSGAIYGAYSENGFPPNGRNYRPWTYSSSSIPDSVRIPGDGGNGGNRSNWTAMTANWNPTNFGCASTGCGAADVRRLWNKSGWNQGRIVYYGGLNPAPNNVVYMQTYTRIYYPKDTTAVYQAPIPGVSDSAKWIPVMRDSVTHTAQEMAQNPASWFGFQIHEGGRWIQASNGGLSGGLGTWYRNIKVRLLDSVGVPLPFTVSLMNPNANKRVDYGFRNVGGRITGSLNVDHHITFSDLTGRVLLRVPGFAGNNLSYKLPVQSGIVVVQIRSMRGMQTFQVNASQR